MFQMHLVIPLILLFISCDLPSHETAVNSPSKASSQLLFQGKSQLSLAVGIKKTLGMPMAGQRMIGQNREIDG